MVIALRFRVLVKSSLVNWADSIDRRNTIFVGHWVRPETDSALPHWDKRSAVLSLVQDEPAPARRCRKRHPGQDLRAALCRRSRLRGMVLLVSPRNAIWILEIRPDDIRSHGNPS